MQSTLQDTLQTNEALTSENEKLRQESTGLEETLNAKKVLEEINVGLVREQESWSGEKIEYEKANKSLTSSLETLITKLSIMEEAWENKKIECEQTIASLKINLELCQC